MGRVLCTLVVPLRTVEHATVTATATAANHNVPNTTALSHRLHAAAMADAAHAITGKHSEAWQAGGWLAQYGLPL